MAQGDQTDFLSRLTRTLPTGWFPSSAPVLQSVLSGIAQSFADIFSLAGFIASQARLRTASGAWLDAAVYDYLGLSFSRAAGESDASFRARAMAAILVNRNTRAAVRGALLNLTGQQPQIFEPRFTADAGGYGTVGTAYNAAGGWGSYRMPFQFFITAYRPAAGSAFTATDAQIQAAVVSVLPAAVVAWIRIVDPSAIGSLLDINFYLDKSTMA
ncbi:hypothetical protein FHR90_003278 [Endobacter medicaginis]|uniref:Uncharacterized protein n=1 Tax=Endobacter medicaginis TaxID=1181271 RepID=A0A850NMG0_9PROT|nr:hypothetical protein [Endobacter medicaginis]MBB3175423.1 hypothetical protein [Endobacter medicaginis]MCX5476870.1 hypothetical protein [Endobacter medicaginis]NVN29609.1 hypothetical protein [Endobacter medicaginis]